MRRLALAWFRAGRLGRAIKRAAASALNEQNSSFNLLYKLKQTSYIIRDLGANLLLNYFKYAEIDADKPHFGYLCIADSLRGVGMDAPSITYHQAPHESESIAQFA